jgi:hypothetical protein
MGVVPHIVDPRPWLEAELAAKQAELATATDEAERGRLEGEIAELKRSLHGGGVLRWLFPWRHRATPW